MHKIPFVIELLYAQRVPGPQPQRWPEELKSNPIIGHGMFSFYDGLKLGLQLAASCHEWE